VIGVLEGDERLGSIYQLKVAEVSFQKQEIYRVVVSRNYRVNMYEFQNKRVTEIPLKGPKIMKILQLNSHCIVSQSYKGEEIYLLNIKDEEIKYERILFERSHKILNVLKGGDKLAVLKNRGKDYILDVYIYDQLKMSLKPSGSLDVSDKPEFHMAFYNARMLIDNILIQSATRLTKLYLESSEIRLKEYRNYLPEPDFDCQDRVINSNAVLKS